MNRVYVTDFPSKATPWYVIVDRPRRLASRHKNRDSVFIAIAPTASIAAEQVRNQLPAGDDFIRLTVLPFNDVSDTRTYEVK